MDETVPCSMCGNPKIKVGASGEECLDCVRAINSQKKVILGIVKCDGVRWGTLGIESYFRLKGWERRKS